ncbi:hypothetical protein RND81_04G209300 [Saponaria officinalis]|uniref:MADS-box domain-containing protein n=1 Tax=Saponaria officinalis TaxID=3572 RepID=A0AAW1LNH7_SAPOF
MTRSKVKLEFIVNDSARKATFKKRKKGLLKKIEELTTLCAVDACAIICSPYEDRPEVWPSPSGARRVLSRFANLPEEDQEKKMLDQESYLKQRVSKAKQMLEKIEKDVKEKQMVALLFDCLNGVKSFECLNLEETKDLCAIANKVLGLVLKSKGAFLHEHVGSSSAAHVV